MSALDQMLDSWWKSYIGGVAPNKDNVEPAVHFRRLACKAHMTQQVREQLPWIVAVWKRLPISTRVLAMIYADELERISWSD